MNINTDYLASANAQSRAASRSAPDAAPAQDFSPPSRWDTTDTVEISDQAREALAVAEDETITSVGDDAAEASRRSARKAEIEYTAEDLAGLKARFSALAKSEKDIGKRLGNLIKQKGIKLGPQDQVKIEIDSKGRAIIGGVQDVKTARALERAINSDEKLLEDIAKFQEEEKKVSAELKSVTGVSLSEFANRIDHLQRGGAVDSVLQDTSDAGEAMYTAEEAIGLADQELFLVDEEFAGMISERYANKSSAITFSGEKKILGDSAQGTVDNAMSDAIRLAERAFDELNKALEEETKNMPPKERDEYLARSYVAVNRLSISLNSDGKVTIEGKASKDNKDVDARAEKIIQDLFNEEFKANPATGGQHDYMIAATYLLNSYDESFGSEGGLGLGDAARTLETTYDRGSIASGISSPEREAQIDGAVNVEAKKALEEADVEKSVLENVTVELNDEGKLTATGLPPEDPNLRTIQSALDLLNVKLEDRSAEDARGSDLAIDPEKRLKGLLANWDVLQPGGLNDL